MDIQQLPRLVTRGSLVLAPLLWLVSALVVSALTTDEASQVAQIAHHPDRYYAFTLATLIGTALFVAALVALMELGRGRAPFATIVGAGLCQLGTLVGVADSGTQLVYWQMGTRGADPAQMVALVHRYENAPGAALVFMVGGIAFIVGSLLLGVGLWRAAAAPLWAALCLPVGIVTNIVAFASGSRAVLAGSSLVLLVGLGRIALRGLPAAARAATVPATQ